MAFMQWSENMSVENLTIDQQHQQLITMVNAVYDAMHSGKGEHIVAETVAQLAQYTRTHFAHEERYMQQIGYPELGQHQQIHRNLIARVKDIQDTLASGRHFSSVTLGNFLKDWLTKHIMNHDQKYAAFATAVTS